MGCLANAAMTKECSASCGRKPGEPGDNSRLRTPHTKAASKALVMVSHPSTNLAQNPCLASENTTRLGAVQAGLVSLWAPR